MAKIEYNPQANAGWVKEQAEAQTARRTLEKAGWQQAKALGLVPEPNIPVPLRQPDISAEVRWQNARRKRIPTENGRL